jgi:hypothetical protein
MADCMSWNPPSSAMLENRQKQRKKSGVDSCQVYSVEGADNVIELAHIARLKFHL